MKFQENFPQQEDENIALEEESNIAQELEARSIAKLGDYKKIEKELEEKGIIEEQINRVEDILEKDSEDFSFLSGEDIKILTILELFDKSTFEHGVNTYKIAKEKTNKILGEGVILSKLIEKEGISMESFYRACMMHDIGKIEIPSFLIHNTLTEEEWFDYLYNMVCVNEDEAVREALSRKINTTDSDLQDKESFRIALERENARPVEFVPVKTALSFEEVTELMERGFSPDESLLNIMKAHEVASKKILNEAGLEMEALLAGEHHNYDNKESEEINLPVSQTTLKISSSLAAVIQLADVHEALTKKRTYKEGFPKLQMLAILAEKSMEGHIDQRITRLWIEDELENMPDEEKNTNNANEYLSIINTLYRKK